MRVCRAFQKRISRVNSTQVVLATECYTQRASVTLDFNIISSTCACVCPHCSWAGVWRRKSREWLWRRQKQESRPQRQWPAASSQRLPFPGARSAGEKNLAKAGVCIQNLTSFSGRWPALLHPLLWQLALSEVKGAHHKLTISPYFYDLCVCHDQNP